MGVCGCVAVGGVGVMCSVWDLDLMSVSVQQIVYPVRYAGIGYTIEQHRYTANTLKYVHQRSSINQNLDHIRKIKMMNED